MRTRIDLTQQPLWQRVLVMVGLALVIQVPPLFLFAVRQAGSLGARWGWLAGYFGVFIAIIALALAVYQRTGFGLKRALSWRQARDWIFGGWLVLLCCQLALSYFNRLWYHQTETANNQAIAELMGHDPLVIVAMSIGAVLLSPVAEEVIFRGILIDLFFSRFQLIGPILVSGLVFSAEHASTNPISFLIYFTLGGVLAHVYQRTGHLEYTIAIHALNNLLATGALVVPLLLH